VGQSRKRLGADGKPRYTAYYDDVTGRRRSAGSFASRRGADKAWQRAEAHTSEGRNTDTGRSRQILSRYVEEEWFPHHQIELTTRQNYRYVLDKHILPAFGGYKMIAIQPADIRAWLTTLKDAGVKPATIKYCLSVLSAIFTTAFNDQITTLHPCAGIKAPTVPKAQRRIITPEQFTLIHEACLPLRCGCWSRPTSKLGCAGVNLSSCGSTTSTSLTVSSSCRGLSSRSLRSFILTGSGS